MSNSTYEIGYRRPPQGKRFQKGRSGNPGGRPHPKPLLKRVFDEALAHALQGEEDSVRQAKGGSVVETLARSLAINAIQGRASAQRMVLALIERDTGGLDAESDYKAALGERLQEYQARFESAMAEASADELLEVIADFGREAKFLSEGNFQDNPKVLGRDSDKRPEDVLHRNHADRAAASDKRENSLSEGISEGNSAKSDESSAEVGERPILAEDVLSPVAAAETPNSLSEGISEGNCQKGAELSGATVSHPILAGDVHSPGAGAETSNSLSEGISEGNSQISMESSGASLQRPILAEDVLGLCATAERSDPLSEENSQGLCKKAGEMLDPTAEGTPRMPDAVALGVEVRSNL